MINNESFSSLNERLSKFIETEEAIKNPNRPEFKNDESVYTLVLKDNLWYNEATKKWKKIAKEPIWTRIVNLEMGSKVLEEYIKRNNLGSSNFYGGAVYDNNGDYVGHYSYNGRFWDTKSEYPNFVLYL